jgi:hypothetical protein
MRRKRSVNRDYCVGATSDVNPVGGILPLPEPAQLGEAQDPAIPIQRGHTSEVESKEAQNFSLAKLHYAA